MKNSIIAWIIDEELMCILAYSTHVKGVINFPTIPTIPDITVNNGNVESGKYISQVDMEQTNTN